MSVFERAKVDVPITSIMEIRQSIPGCTITFDIQLFAVNVLEGLVSVAGVFRGVGLVVKSIRATGDGGIVCKVVDNGCDLHGLSASLARADGTALGAWTTTVGFPKADVAGEFVAPMKRAC